MTLTVRLTAQLEEQLGRHCKARGLTKSRVIIELLTEHLALAPARGQTALELAKAFGVIGSFASGQGNLATDRKHLLKEKLRAKRAG